MGKRTFSPEFKLEAIKPVRERHWPERRDLRALELAQQGLVVRLIPKS